MTRLLCIAVAAALHLSLAAAQEGDKAYVAAYKAHVAAMEAGDLETAHVEAERAWRLGEEAGAPARQLEILSWNYAASALDRGDYENAIEAYERSLDLADAKDAAAFEGALDRRIGLSFAYRQTGADGKARKTLKSVADAMDGVDVSPVIAGRYWIEYAAAEAADKRGYREVAAIAAKAEAALEEAGQADGVYGAQAALLQGYLPETRADWEEAEAHYQRAYERVAGMPNDAPFKTMVSGRLGFVTREAEGFRRLKDREGDAEEDCGCTFKHKRRDVPQYPPSAALAGLTGYVFVSYDIEHDGSVSDVKVLNSWPEDVFDDAVLRAVKKWRYEPILDPEGRPYRAEDHVVHFPFVLAN